MKAFLIELGLRNYDVALLVLCPLGALLGSLAHVMLHAINPHRMPPPGSVRIVSGLDAMGRLRWIYIRLSLGLILGIVIALYFIGAVQENITTLAKIVALSILLGYAAPKLWLAQERIVVEQALNMLNEFLRRAQATPADGQSIESIKPTAPSSTTAQQSSQTLDGASKDATKPPE